VRIGIGIITVEGRLARAGALAQQLVDAGYTETPFVNVDHQRQGPWWNFRFTSQALFDEGYTHACVLEDDVRLCPGFLGQLPRVVSICPNDPLSLFTARSSIVKEADKRRTKLLCRFGLDTAQGLVFPKFQFEAMCRWVDGQEPEKGKAWSFHGDVRISEWAKARRWPVIHVVPNLVDHDVSIPSTLGHSGKTRYGERVSPRLFDGVPDFDWGQPR
jgi:hypothetical protein